MTNKPKELIVQEDAMIWYEFYNSFYMRHLCVLPKRGWFVGLHIRYIKRKAKRKCARVNRCNSIYLKIIKDAN